MERGLAGAKLYRAGMASSGAFSSPTSEPPLQWHARARARACPHLRTEEDAAVEEAPAAVEELDGPEAVHPHQQLHRKQLRPPYNTPASCVRGRGRGRVRARPGEKAVRERESWQLCVRAARERARCNRLLRASSLCVPWQGRLKPVEAPPRD